MAEQKLPIPLCDPRQSNRWSPIPHSYKSVNEDGVEVMVCQECGRRVHPKGTR